MTTANGELATYRLRRRREALALGGLAGLLVASLAVGGLAVAVIVKQATTIERLSNLRADVRQLRRELARRPLPPPPAPSSPTTTTLEEPAETPTASSPPTGTGSSSPPTTAATADPTATTAPLCPPGYRRRVEATLPLGVVLCIRV
jgi:hypothetical protein